MVRQEVSGGSTSNTLSAAVGPCPWALAGLSGQLWAAEDLKGGTRRHRTVGDCWLLSTVILIACYSSPELTRPTVRPC